MDDVFIPRHINAMQNMTLRDYFAGQALAGVIGINISEQKIAEYAYLYADAMIAERNKSC